MKKIVIFVIVLVMAAILADYYGIISLPSLEKPTIMETKGKMINKSEEALK